jgi:hypothetical protein
MGPVVNWISQNITFFCLHFPTAFVRGKVAVSLFDTLLQCVRVYDGVHPPSNSLPRPPGVLPSWHPISKYKAGIPMRRLRHTSRRRSEFVLSYGGQFVESPLSHHTL